MSLGTQPALHFSLTELIDLLHRAFTGYVGGDLHFEPATFANFLTAEDIHLGRSLVALRDSQPVGLALIARRGWTSRVAAMGIVPEAQGQGVGKWFMEQLADEGRARGDRMLALEVIEQNPRGVRLYESCGFKTIRRLHGYSGANLIGAAATLTPIDVAECARHISAWSQPDLPWQCSGATLAKADPPHVGYQLDGCYAIITDPNAGSMVVRGLAVPPDRQRQGWGTRLVAALVAAHPGKSWHVPAICPAEFGPLFTGNGFTQDNLSQFQMALTL